MGISVGDIAPDFELRSTGGEMVKLSDFRGQRNVLLLFFPYVFSPTCYGEFCQLRDDNFDLSSDESVAIFGISVDAAWSQRAWKDQERFNVDFLADFWPHGAVAQSYGVLNDERGSAKRQTFLIDREGVVRFHDENPTGQARDQAEWRKVIASLA